MTVAPTGYASVLMTVKSSPLQRSFCPTKGDHAMSRAATSMVASPTCAMSLPRIVVRVGIGGVVVTTSSDTTSPEVMPVSGSYVPSVVGTQNVVYA